MLCIGFGRWPPQNVTEVWLTVISMMVGATFYALFIGNMSTLLLSIDSSGRIYNEKVFETLIIQYVFIGTVAWQTHVNFVCNKHLCPGHSSTKWRSTCATANYHRT